MTRKVVILKYATFSLAAIVALLLLLWGCSMPLQEHRDTASAEGGERVGTYIDKSQLASKALSTDGLEVGVLEPDDLAQLLVGTGVTISNVTYIGTENSAGVFSGGASIIGFEEGIILCSGDIANVVGPNLYDSVTLDNYLPGDPDLNSLIPGYVTYDATILEFDFVPDSSVVEFTYVFGSDEYNEYVNTQFNDVFGFFINGVNVATIPISIPVSINNINGGGPIYGTVPSNPAYYINNDLDDGGGFIDTEMDGMTVVLTVTANVNPDETNHIKLAIADAGDSILDSFVLIQAGSFVAPSLNLFPIEAVNDTGTGHILTASATLGGEPVPGILVEFMITAGPHAGYGGTSWTDVSGIATWGYTGTSVGIDTIEATATIGNMLETSNKAYKEWVGPPVPQAELWAVEYCWGDPAPGFSFNGCLFTGWTEVRIENRGEGDAYNVTATVMSWPDNTEVPEPEVTVGDIPSGESAWSQDTFTTVVDLCNPVDPGEKVYWLIEYDDEAGNHHEIEMVPEFPPGEGPSY